MGALQHIIPSFALLSDFPPPPYQVLTAPRVSWKSYLLPGFSSISLLPDRGAFPSASLDLVRPCGDLRIWNPLAAVYVPLGESTHSQQ